MTGARKPERIVPALRDSGYDVDYREFSRGHVVPNELVQAALNQFLTGGGGAAPTE